MDTLNITFFTNQQTITALEYLRVMGPISHTDMKIQMGMEYKDNIHNTINESDLVIVQRDFPSDYNLFIEIIQKSKELEKPVIYDLDDNLYTLSKNHPDRKLNYYSKALIPMFMAGLEADYLTVSNDYLKQQLSDLNRNIFVLPNLLDETIWPLQTPVHKERKQPLIIGYMGGDSHLPDIEFITPLLLDIKAEFSDEVSFHFYGLKPPDSLLSLSDTIWTPDKTYDYKEFAKDFQKVDVDLFIAPLIDNEFNRCKSPIKFLEYSSLGVPGIFSDVYPYQNVITDGETGLLASSPEEWANKIRLLIHDSARRHKIAENAQKLIRDKYLMKKNSYLWKNTYQKIINQGITKGIQENISAYKVIKIMEQLMEYHNDIQSKLINTREMLQNEKSRAISLESRLEDLKENNENLKQDVTKMEILQEQNKNLKQEVLYYALSKSWRFTRPLRKIRKIIRGKE